MPKVIEQTPTKTQYRLRPQGMWTYEDWLNFPNDGWKYEIINGALYMTPPPATGHQRSSGSLFARMYIHAEDNDLGEVLEAPCGVRLPNQIVPFEPDIFFIKKEQLYIIHDDYVDGVPDLIIEILSPSSISYDRRKKFDIYQGAGVPEYWLVDYRNKTVEVFTLLKGTYILSGKHEMGDIVVSEQIASFKIPVEVIFNF